MANPLICIPFVERHEDESLACEPATDSNGYGVLCGINEKWWPLDYARIVAMPQSERLGAVTAFYVKNYWNQWYAQVNSDEVAKRVLDMAVNTVEKTAVKLLQQALNTFHINGPLVADGWWGPLTIGIANGFDASSIVAAFQQLRVAHYKENDADSPLLPQLIARALD